MQGILFSEDISSMLQNIIIFFQNFYLNMSNKDSSVAKLAGYKRKRDEDEQAVAVAGEGKSRPKKPTHGGSSKHGVSAHHKNHRRRKDDDGDEEMPDEDDDDPAGSSAPEAINDSEEYDDEDEDDEAASLDSFIVDDNEVESSAPEDEGHGKKEKPPKKHRRRKPRKLDEDDLDLINENTGINLKKRKRLQKVADFVEGEEEGNAEPPRVKGEVQSEEDEDARHFVEAKKSAKADVEEESQTEQIDTTRKRIIDPPYRTTELTDKQRKMRQNLENAADARRLKQSRETGGAAASRDGDDIDDMFDADELGAQFSLPNDKAIAMADIPERLQVKILDRLSFKFESKEEFRADLEREVNYIYNRLFMARRDHQGLANDLKIKRAVEKILTLIREENLDVPFVSTNRSYVYADSGLTESDVWTIFNLEQEYAKFRLQYTQLKEQLIRVVKAVKEHSVMEQYQYTKHLLVLKSYLDDLDDQMKESTSVETLKNFLPAVNFFKQFYKGELEKLEIAEGEVSKRMPSARSHYDELERVRALAIDDISSRLFMHPSKFVKNCTNNILENPPPEDHRVSIERLIQIKLDDETNYTNKVQMLFKFTAVELSIQPYIRSLVKNMFYTQGSLITNPTSEGQKTLDVFHPSYRVKRIRMKLNEIREKTQSIESAINDGGDLFLDVIQNENQQLIKVELRLEPESRQNIINMMHSRYCAPDSHPLLINYCREVITKMVNDILLPELAREVRAELIENAEQVVVKRAQQAYENLLMTGPFSNQVTKLASLQSDFDFGTPQVPKPRRAAADSDIIPDRPRCVVMSVIVNQVDTNSNMATVAVVDKYGELVAHQSFFKLMQPRKLKGNRGAGGEVNEEERRRQAKLENAIQEEQKDHDADREKIKTLIRNHNVDLIVVGANKLEGRSVKKTLTEICEQLKTHQVEQDEKKKRNDEEGESKKEVFVIWGSLEVPRLSVTSQLSQKLMKQADVYLKQAVSLARFQQDPLNEVLNLWSFELMDNQALQLNLHPLQKRINQQKLVDALEETNVKVINKVGVDLNLAINHDHMHILFSFLCALGPRKAKRFILLVKVQGKPIIMRSQLYNLKLLSKDCAFQANSFIKIRVKASEHIGQQIHLLDQTRIPLEAYNLTLKIASDCINCGGTVEKWDQYCALKMVLQDPRKLQEFNLEKYKEEIIMTGQLEMCTLADFIVSELREPMKDPRAYRTIANANPSPDKLFYMLIEESEQTFKRGMIVTATVLRVFEGKDGKDGASFALCKLDNGLEARVDQKNIDNQNRRRLEDLLSTGAVLTGRIDLIKNENEERFSVILNCQPKVLESHKGYVEGMDIPEEDLLNTAFKQAGPRDHQQRFIHRRITHPNFKNVTSQKALQVLQDEGQENGEFIFRPSSKGINNITLTWKFFFNNYVHADIQEHEKPPGASIGTKLQIGTNDIYDNLQEIVERHIQPVNKLVIEASNHAKFLRVERLSQFEEALQKEKAEEPGKIPYRLTIVPDYPQYILLAYIPKNLVKKEYIKVKPKGYWFHDEYRKNIQALINWFKENFNNSDYIKYQKRQKSPRARVPEAQSLQRNQMSSEQERDQWGNIGANWNGARSEHNQDACGSVHSAGGGDDDQGRPVGFGSRGGGFGRGGRGGAGAGSQPNVCFNCQEPGHISKECTQPRKPRAFGSFGGNQGGAAQLGVGRGRAGPIIKSDGAFGEDNNNNFGRNSGNFGQNDAWGGSGSDVMMKEPAQPAAPDWGQDTPQPSWGNSDNVPQVQPSWNDDNQQNNTGDQWGSASGGFGDNNGGSGGRASRGRGIRPGPGGPAQGGQRSTACFKCHQEGHMSKDCPSAPAVGFGGAGRGAVNRTCYKCNEEGHIAKECPNVQNDNVGRSRPRGPPGSGSQACFKCGQEGHMAKDCTQEQGNKRLRYDEGVSNRRGGFGRGPGPQNESSGNWENAQPSTIESGNNWTGSITMASPAGPDQWATAGQNFAPASSTHSAYGGGNSEWGAQPSVAQGGGSEWGAVKKPQETPGAWGAKKASQTPNDAWGANNTGNQHQSNNNDGW